MFMKERRAINRADSLVDSNGNLVEDEAEVLKILPGFYMDLLGSCAHNLQAIVLPLVKRGRAFNSSQCQDMIIDISEVEDWNSLNNLGDNKDPGSDAFDA